MLMTNANDVLTFMLAGKATLTVVSAVTEKSFTFKVNKKDTDSGVLYFVQVMTGSDNESSYTFLGTIFPNGYKHGRRSKIGEDAPSAKAFTWLYRQLMVGNLPETVRVYSSGKCGRCGRRLTTEESVTMGIGPECADKMGLAA